VQRGKFLGNSQLLGKATPSPLDLWNQKISARTEANPRGIRSYKQSIPL